MGKKLIKSVALTFGTSTHSLAKAHTGMNQTCDAVDVTSLADTVHQYIKGALVDNDEFTLTLFQGEGTDIKVTDAPAALTLAVTLTDGTTDTTANVAIAKAIVTKVQYPDQESDGDRKATYDVTFRPDGSTASGNGGGGTVQ